MAKKPRRRVSLSTLQAALIAVVDYNLSVIQDTCMEHRLRLDACQSLTAACVAYKQISEFDDLHQNLAQELAATVQDRSPPPPDPVTLTRGPRRTHLLPYNRGKEGTDS